MLSASHTLNKVVRTYTDALWKTIVPKVHLYVCRSLALPGIVTFIGIHKNATRQIHCFYFLFNG